MDAIGSITMPTFNGLFAMFALAKSIRNEATDYTAKSTVSIGNIMILRIAARFVAGVMSIW